MLYKATEIIEYSTGLFIILLAAIMVFKDLRRNKQDKLVNLSNTNQTDK